jgi:hypothetical protein
LYNSTNNQIEDKVLVLEISKFDIVLYSILREPYGVCTSLTIVFEKWLICTKDGKVMSFMSEVMSFMNS